MYIDKNCGDLENCRAGASAKKKPSEMSVHLMFSSSYLFFKELMAVYKQLRLGVSDGVKSNNEFNSLVRT